MRVWAALLPRVPAAAPSGSARLADRAPAGRGSLAACASPLRGSLAGALPVAAMAHGLACTTVTHLPLLTYRQPTGNLPATARRFTSDRAMTPLVLPTRESDVLVRSLLPRGLLTKHGASHEPVGDQIWGRHEHVAEGDQISHREMV